MTTSMEEAVIQELLTLMHVEMNVKRKTHKLKIAENVLYISKIDAPLPYAHIEVSKGNRLEIVLVVQRGDREPMQRSAHISISSLKRMSKFFIDQLDLEAIRKGEQS